ncbi:MULTISPECIES: hypothetical protein [Streptomyces]|uniref:hypothetical protein n=1 Tax=Streptomyces TaxID=1883 RepID=UPI001C84BFEB|nr:MULTISPECIES: hypothetical protein [unclassified Streptomyces]MCX2925553.1 hypothetical protein [Streptomyces sp. NEAU-W12]
MRKNRAFFAAAIGAACLNVVLFAGTANAGTDDDLPWTKAGSTLTTTVGTDDDLPWTGPTPSPLPAAATITADAPSGDTDPDTGGANPDLPWTR